MATAQEIIDRAWNRMGLANVAGEAADATTSASMLTTLQDLMSEWAEDSLIEVPPPSALSDTIDVPDGQIRALYLNLALEYSDNVGKQPSNRLQQFAMTTKNRLVGQSSASRELNLAAGGVPNVSQGLYDINSDSGG